MNHVYQKIKFGESSGNFLKTITEALKRIKKIIFLTF